MNEPIAIKGLTNTASLLIYDIDDYAVTVSLNKGVKREYKLYSTNKGFYFNYKGNRYYIHEFIRMVF